MDNQEISVQRIRQWLLDLQQRICTGLAAADGQALFEADDWERPAPVAGDSVQLGGGGKKLNCRNSKSGQSRFPSKLT